MFMINMKMKKNDFSWFFFIFIFIMNKVKMMKNDDDDDDDYDDKWRQMTITMPNIIIDNDIWRWRSNGALAIIVMDAAP